jgi:hypothetical protein
MARVLKTVVKIDLIDSESYFLNMKSENEHEIRKAFSKTVTTHFPSDSIYSYEGDAYWLLFESATVAMRKCVIFMQLWEDTISSYPEKIFCRIAIDTGEIFQDQIDSSKYTGTPFINISRFEKHIKNPDIVFTKMTYNLFEKSAFSFIEHDYIINKKTNDKIYLYKLIYDNPRTFKESALFDATFLMSEEAEKAREKCITFLIYQSIHENTNNKCNLDQIQKYISKYLMSDIPKAYLLELINNNDNIIKKDKCFELNEYILNKMDSAKKEYLDSKFSMVDYVHKSITNEGFDLENVKIDKLLDDLLCSIFGDFKLMANYTQMSFIHIDIKPKEMHRHERIFKKYFPLIFEKDEVEYELIKNQIIQCLKNIPKNCEFYIASVFHNILGSFYLNKKEDFFVEQQKRLKNITIYLDTNILLSYFFENANAHEKIRYVIEQCRKREIKLRVFYRTCQEYDNHLKFVHDLYHKMKERTSGYTYASYLLSTKSYPIYREYIQNSAKYQHSFKVCTQAHAISSNIFSSSTEINDFSFLESEKIYVDKNKLLNKKNDDYAQKRQKWHDTLMSFKRQSTSTIDEMWEEIERQSSINYNAIILHDVECLLDIEKINNNSSDQIYFLTLDKKLIRAHKEVMNSDNITVVDVDQMFSFLIPFFLNEEKSGHDIIDSATSMLKTQLGVFFTAFPIDRDDIIKLLSNISITSEMIYEQSPKRVEAILKTLQNILLDFSKRKQLESTLNENEINLVEANTKLMENLVKVRNLEKLLEEEKQEKELLLLKLKKYESQPTN